jgi:hypothetical protein
MYISKVNNNIRYVRRYLCSVHNFYIDYIMLQSGYGTVLRLYF